MELGKREQLTAADSEWKRRICLVAGTVFVLQRRISSRVGRAEGGERAHLHCSSQKHHWEVDSALARRTRVPVLPAAACSLSAGTSVQKLLVYMKHFLVRLEITIFSSCKCDGGNRFLTVFCLRIEV